MRITIKELTDKMVDYTVCANDNVAYLKNLIEERRDIPTYQQKLFFDKKQLEDGKTLGEYNITDGSIVFLVHKLYGC